MKKLGAPEIKTALATVPDWKKRDLTYLWLN
jgi:hypothetical protein